MASAREKLIEDLKALLNEDVTAVKDQVEHLKTQFYREYHEEIEAAKNAVNEATDSISEAADSVVDAVQPKVDALEEQFKALLNEYKAKRAEVAALQAKEQAENLKKKQAILDVMKTLAEAETADVMDNLKRMRELQAEWKTIGPVPVEKVQELRKAYQQYQEQFYDLVKINIELRDLDFKKNLEAKTLLCEAAERLQNNDNILEASRALQQLHEEWAEIGPVARELREGLWERFKTASSAINKKHQEYFDKLHAKEKENLEAKQAIIEQLKTICQPLAEGQNLSAKQWEAASEQVQALQEEWRKIGFAPKKFNQSIYEEYRTLCNDFYKAKTAHFKGLRDELSANLAKKRDLVERARELAESKDWNNTADAIRALQTEWKTIGPVARKYSDDLWNQFTTACDTFFNAKREAAKESRAESRKSKFEKAVKTGGDNLYRLRENLRQEIKVAENNILFFTAKSKTANKLVDSMQSKIDALKAKLAEVEQKMKEEDE
jgi:chromosome segregation ATPase